jgi:hypothetical protein
MSDPPDPFLPFDGAPGDIISYVYEMVGALAKLADREGDTELALQLRLISEHRRTSRGQPH